MKRSLAALVVLVMMAGVVPAPRSALAETVAAPAKKLLDYHAYAAWRAIRDTRVSPDGNWIAYAEVPAEADGTLTVYPTITSTPRPQTYHEARGRAPAFTADSHFVVYRIDVPVATTKAETKAETAAGKRTQPGLGILQLASGTVTTVERLKSFKLSAHGSTLAALIEPTPAPTPSTSPTAASPVPVASAAPVPSASASPAPKGPGKDAATSLMLQRLGTSDATTIANVTAYVLSADGTHAAYVVQTKADESIRVRNLVSGTETTIAHGTAHLSAPALDEAGTHLAYLSDPDAYVGDATKSKEDGTRPPFRLMVADTTSGAVTQAFGDVTARTFAVDATTPEFTKDGTRVAFAWATAPAPRPSSAPARVELDFWYAREGKLPTQKRIEAEEPGHDSYLALYDLAQQKTIRLATPDMPEVSLVSGARYALGFSNVPYEKYVTWDTEYYDVYRIDLATGARTLLQRKVKSYLPELSPSGDYALGYNSTRRGWYTLRMRDGRITYISDNIRSGREDDDHPADPPPYGAGGWTMVPAGRVTPEAIIYDRYDVWAIPADGGTPQNLTKGDGRARHRIYRIAKPRTDEPASVFQNPKFVSPFAPGAHVASPLLLTFTDDRTKASGFATIPPFGAAVPKVTMLRDAAIGSLQRARDADRLVFTIERFDQFPDLWTSLGAPSTPERVSDANPQQAQYAWGHSRLIDYTNARGEHLRAILTTPEGFDPHKHYPMLVYVYEKMSDDLHRYIQPASGTVVNLARYANHGYVVLQPDITYQIGHTVASAVDCVGSAVKRVVAMGFVDPKRIGMAGHSYGGFEVNALVTHTNIFRAVESGASDSDLTSLYGGFWQSGDVQQSYYERSQGRIGATPWERPDLYVENSPIFFVDRVHAPYLRIQDDKDGSVPYGQGVEFFTALRRAGKEAYMFTFIGENHGLAGQANKNYWTVHLDEFFDHELQGAPRPDWMNHDIPFEARGLRNIDSLFTPATFTL